MAEYMADLFAFSLAEQAMVHKYAGKTAADGPVNQGGGHSIRYGRAKIFPAAEKRTGERNVIRCSRMLQHAGAGGSLL